MKIRKTLQYCAVALMASTPLSTTVSAMGLLVAMGPSVVPDSVISAEKEVSTIEPASGCDKKTSKHPHEVRRYND
jgi:hypothetical protein